MQLSWLKQVALQTLAVQSVLQSALQSALQSEAITAMSNIDNDEVKVPRYPRFRLRKIPGKPFLQIFYFSITS